MIQTITYLLVLAASFTLGIPHGDITHEEAKNTTVLSTASNNDTTPFHAYDTVSFHFGIGAVSPAHSGRQLYGSKFRVSLDCANVQQRHFRKGPRKGVTSRRIVQNWMTAFLAVGQ